MKKVPQIIICLLSLCCYNSKAQVKTLDSLWRITGLDKKDTSTTGALIAVADYYLLANRNCDSALYYAARASKISEGLNDKRYMAISKLYTGAALRCQGDYANAYKYIVETRKTFTELGDNIYLLKCLRSIGGILDNQGNSADALETFFSALSLSEKISDTAEIMRCLVDISRVFYGNGKYDIALDYAKRCEKLAYNQPRLRPRDVVTEQLGYIYKKLKNDSLSLHYQMESLHLSEQQKDTLGLANSFIQLGDFFSGIKKFDEAIAYFTKAEQMYRVINQVSGLTYSLIARADVYLQLHKPGLALQSYYESLRLSQAHKDSRRMIDNYSNIGLTYLEMAQFNKAKLYLDTSLHLSETAHDPFAIKEAHENLSRLYDSLHQPAEAYLHYKKSIYLQDSINEKDQADKLLDMEAKRNFAKVVFESKEQQEKQRYEARTTIYALLAGLVFVVVVAFFLYNNNRHKQKAKAKVEAAFEKLKSTQSQLIQSEKMASLGELTAGIAHEIQNPLNFVNNFSEVSNELIDELVTEKAKVKSERDEQLEDELLADIKQNLEKINHHGKRADAIVKGMLQHSRKSTGQKEPTDINALADEYLRLSYHGLRAKDKSFNATLNTDFDETIGKINIIPQDIGRVLLNLYNNAFYAAMEKQKEENPHPPESSSGKALKGGKEYQPTVTVSTKLIKPPLGGLGVSISVADNGNGIPQKIVDKIFQPFFTTKPTGQGTGLGLSLSYDIVRAHGGEIKVQTSDGEGATFIVHLPVA